MDLMKTNVANLQKFKNLGWQYWSARVSADVIIRWIWKIAHDCQTHWLSNTLTVKHIDCQTHRLSNTSTVKHIDCQIYQLSQCIHLIWCSRFDCQHIDCRMHRLLNTSTVKFIDCFFYASTVKCIECQTHQVSNSSASAKNTRTEYPRLTFQF